MTDDDVNVGGMDDWAVWQLVDPLLPTGGFAHSQGLEAAAHARLVAGLDERVLDRTGWDVDAFCFEAVRNASSLAVPFVEAARFAHHPATAFTSGDAHLAGNHVAHRASVAMGAAFIRAAIAAYGDDATIGAKLKDVKRISRVEKSGGHLATTFGAVVGCLGLSTRRAARLFAYLTLRDVLSAATRLNLVGPLEAAASLRRCSGRCDEMAAEAALSAAALRSGAPKEHAVAAAVSRAANTSPLTDLIQGGHDALYSRLFSS
jgi:urease accessory protein UreF